MTEVITQTEYKSFKDIDKLYEGNTLPVFTEAAAIAIRSFLDDHECLQIAGGILLTDSHSMKEAKSVVRHRFHEERIDTFHGPFIMNDHLYLSGIGVWTTGDMDSSSEG